MRKYSQTDEKNDIVSQAAVALQKPFSAGIGVTTTTTTVKQEAGTLEAADLFAHFTANIIKEERLFIR